jgi:dihydroneopterin aldolase/2-amino-4-hydroxy-6-hydroxymethyldihydropteridine diphosphokinase/dihydropteroate synthase
MLQQGHPELLSPPWTPHESLVGEVAGYFQAQFRVTFIKLRIVGSSATYIPFKMPSDTITITALSCHLPNGLGPSAFGLSSPPPCPILLTLAIHLDPAVIPLCVSDDTMSGLGVNYSSVSKAVYALMIDPQRTWAGPEEVMEAAAGVPLSLASVISVDVTVELPRALLHADSATYKASFGYGRTWARSMQVKSLRLDCIVGLHPHERGEKQRLDVDLQVEGYEGQVKHKALADAALSVRATCQA